MRGPVFADMIGLVIPVWGFIAVTVPLVLTPGASTAVVLRNSLTKKENDATRTEGLSDRVLDETERLREQLAESDKTKEAADDLSAAAKSGDQAAVQKALQEGNTASSKADQLAGQLGLDSCKG